MKNTYVDGEKLARNGRKTAIYFAASFFFIIEGFYFRICDYTIEASYKKEQIFHVESYNVLLFWWVKIKMHVSYNEWSLEFILKFPFAVFKYST